MSKKMEYKASDTLVTRLRKDDGSLMKWAGIQSELGDAIRYLIEQEVQKNGYEDVSRSIKRSRLWLPTAKEIQPVLLNVLFKEEGLREKEVIKKVAEDKGISLEERLHENRVGDGSQWTLNVLGSKEELIRLGLVEEKEGVWSLTDEGREQVE